MRLTPSSTGNPHAPPGPAIRPGVALLVYHILKALLVDGRLPLAIAIVAFAGLYFTNLYNDSVVVLAGAGLALLALVRGCIDWQKDFSDYQHALARRRHRIDLEELTDPTQRLASRHR
jgi:hypothetical protein